MFMFARPCLKFLPAVSAVLYVTACYAQAAPLRQSEEHTAAVLRPWLAAAERFIPATAPEKLVIAAAFAAFLLYLCLKLLVHMRRRGLKRKADNSIRGENRTAPSEAQVLKEAKEFFLRVQNAWDRRDLSAMAHMTAPAMQAQVQAQAKEDPEPSGTDFLWVKAELVSQAEEQGQQRVVVYFTALLREDPRQEDAIEMRELWHLARPLSGGPWLLEAIRHVSA